MLEAAEDPRAGPLSPKQLTPTPGCQVALNTLEAVWLSDNIRGADVDEGDADRPTVQELIGRALLEKVGSVFLELIPEDLSKLNTPEVKAKTVPINITLQEAWLVRDKIRTGDLGFDNITNIGIPLLRKVYAVILECEDIEIETRDGADRTLSPDERSALTLLFEKENRDAGS